MDNGRPSTKRICVSYLVTLALLASFFYYLMADNQKHNKGISRLREDVDDISHMLRQQQQQGCRDQKTNKLDCSACESGAATGVAGGGKCDSREISGHIESIVKRKLGGIMDDVYNLKKQIMGTGCGFQSSQSHSPSSEAVAVSKTRINYASEELGARIISVLAKPIGGTNLLKTLLGLDFSANPPVNMLRPSLAPGSCFGYSGVKATVGLHLAKEIIVEAISLTHVSKEMTPNLCVNSAPKDFEVYGVPKNNQNHVFLGKWTYNNAPAKRTQIFAVVEKSPFHDLMFTFNSNHGAEQTCIYRIEVYGQLQSK